jgi:tetratricopeptide (TPR) repeat protein
MACLTRSIEQAESFGGLFPQVLGEQRLAQVETALGQYALAHKRIRRALTVARNATDNAMVRGHTPARLLATAVRNRLEVGDLARATEYLAEGFAEQARAGDCPTCDVMLYPEAVSVYVALGDLTQAEHACRKAEQTALLFASSAWTASARYCHGLLSAARDDHTAAAHSFEAALLAFEALGQLYDVARSLEALATVAGRGEQRASSPAELRQRAAEIYTHLGSPRATLLTDGEEPRKA